MKKCPEGCACGKHTKTGNPCTPGCTCARHSCPDGCTCSRHAKPSAAFVGSDKCEPGCTCGRHQGPWTGKKRPDMAGRQPALRHGHTWQDPATGEARVSLTYKSWQAMKYRCGRPSNHIYRDIDFCPRWLVFENFLADMGPRPSLDYSIDRIDNEGGYWCGRCDWCTANGRPSNCRWATRSEQQNNRRPQPDQPNQYSTGAATVRVNECGHPELRHRAKGMCNACYQRHLKK